MPVPFIKAAIAGAAVAFGLAQPAAAQEAPPAWLATLQEMNLDLTTIGTSDFSRANVPPLRPFGELPVSLAPPEVEQVGTFLVGLSGDQFIELVQRCRVIVDNMEVYNVPAVALCNTAFDILDLVEAAVPSDRMTPEPAGAGAVLRGPGYSITLQPRSFSLQAQRERMHQGDPGLSGWYFWGPSAAGGIMLPSGLPHQHLTWLLFILIDTDGDGAVSLEEWQAASARIFTALDRDGNGRLDHEELRLLPRGHGGSR